MSVAGFLIVILIYLLGLPLSAGLMGGIGNFSEHPFSDTRKNRDFWFLVFWPVSWVVWILYKLGLWIQSID